MTLTVESPDAKLDASGKAPKEKLPSTAAYELGLKFGQHLVRRRAAEWVLSHTPAPMAEGIRTLVAKGFRAIGDKYMINEEELFRNMNGKLFMSTHDAESGGELLEEVPKGYVESLFPKGQQDKWPRQFIICTKDIIPQPEMMHKRMQNIPKLIDKLLQHEDNRVDTLDESVAGKTVVVGAYHTDNSMLHNGADVVERVQEIRRDPLSLKGMSPAAMAMGEALLDLMTQHKDNDRRVLRDDAPDIMRHTMLHGFSQGGNITSDAFRFMRHEMRTKRVELALDDTGTRTAPLNHDAAIAKLFAGSYIMNIAAADVPFSRAELSCMPPRDNIRSDGDMVVSGAVGLNKQQSNYNYHWKQDELNLLRNDRLLEAIGPVKRFLGFGHKGEHDAQYHALLGHSEKVYWDSAMDQAKTSLQERLTARFTDKSVACDLTFSGDGTIKLDFERGTRPETAEQNLRRFVDAVTQDGSMSVVPSSDPSVYKVRLKAPMEQSTLTKIEEAFKAADIMPTKEVGLMLGIADRQPALERRIEKIPGAKVSTHFGEKGPYFEIDMGECAGPKTFGLLKREMEKHGLPTANKELEGSKLRVTGDDLIASIKFMDNKIRVKSNGR